MCNTVLLLLCGLISISTCLPHEENFWSGKAILLGVSNETKCTAQFSCSDCSTARICKPDGAGGFEQVTTIPCPTSAPYCTGATGTCGQVPDDSCGVADTTFVCMDDGNFPDANCTNYHICTGFSAFKYQCAVKGENYDPEQKKCTADAPCGTYKCTAAGVKVAHSIYPEYFGYCSASGALPAVIARCKGSYQLNETSQLCEPICNKEGTQPDVDNCTKYYKCHKEMFPSGDQGDWVEVMIRDHLDCPTGTAFAPDQFMCVDIKQTDCKPPV